MDVSVVTHQDRVVVGVAGSVDVFTVSRLRQALLPLVIGADTDVFVDCSRLERIDATGLGVLVAALRLARRSDVQFAIADPTPAMRNLLRETRLDRWLPVVDLPAVGVAG